MSITTSKSNQLSQEIASREKINPYLGSDLGALMMSLPNPDPVLKKLGCDIEVYRDIMVDPVIKGAVRRRRSAVVGLEYGLDQGDASDKVMDLCKQVLANIKLRTLIRELHDAAWYGYSPAEVYWTKDNGLWIPSKVVGKPPEWFGFNGDNDLCFKGFDNMSFEPVPDMKFIMARNDATFNNPYGVADMAAVYWYAIFRKGGLKFWLRFADKYGQAFIVGKHPRGTPQLEVDKILDSLEVLSQDGIGAIPNDGSVEIIEAAGKGATADMFERLLKYCRSEINIALLGQDQSTDSSSTNASAQAGLEVTDDIRDADGEMISDAINELLRYVVRLNIGDNEPMPVWSMWSDEDVTEALANRDEKLQKAGARLTKTYFMRAYKLGEDDVDVDAPLTAQARSRGRAARGRQDEATQDSGVKADFSENPSPTLAVSKEGRFTPIRIDYADTNVDKMANASQPYIDDWLTRLKVVIDSAPNLEALPDMLANAFSDLPNDELVEVIALGMTAAELAGGAEVVGEAVLNKDGSSL
ncbi:DUF935 domain-containing protein [Psychrobacter lutiphocae]|uniref:DUF935 domain-containing protein n=1 Tax=Psychrobacter lutiphocae TaxID=540500 RepID=UPI0003731AEF|nr:DUF935 family protein [Psychrobacter lutiphocae]